MISLEELLSSGGKVTVTSSRTRTSYELRVEAEALKSVRTLTIRERIEEVQAEWDKARIHHAYDLDPIRDEEAEDDDGFSQPWGTSTTRKSVVYEQVDLHDRTLFDGLPVEVLTREDKRPEKVPGQEGRRSLVAQALRQARARVEGTVGVLPD